ncbi:MAG: hypothetical protein ACREX8_16555, partial [Gammaproteobacteria bacterium]
MTTVSVFWSSQKPAELAPSSLTNRSPSATRAGCEASRRMASAVLSSVSAVIASAALSATCGA